MTDLGKIVTTYEGEYNSDTEYEIYTVVHHKQALWITKRDKVRNSEPSKTNPDWRYLLEDGYSNTIVAYNTVVRKEGWVTSRDYSEYSWQNTFEVNGVTASSVPIVNFDFKEMVSNNFGPMCKSSNNAITIYAQNKPDEDITLPIITASRFLDDQKLLTDSIRNDLQIQIDQTNDDLKTNIDEVKRIEKENFDTLSEAILRNRSEVDEVENAHHTAVVQSIEELTATVTTNRAMDKQNDESIVANLNTNVLIKKDTVVQKEAFTETREYAEFPYRAEIAFQGLTEDYVPNVILDYTEAISGDFAPISKALTDKIYIYSNYIPDVAITIPSIICEKQSNVQLVSEEEE